MKHTTVNKTFNTNSHAQIGTEHFIFLFFIEFQCTHGLLGCHGEKAVTSELKFRHFFSIPLTVKVWPFLTRRCTTREKCHVTVIFGSFSDLNFGKIPEFNKKPENNEAWCGRVSVLLLWSTTPVACVLRNTFTQGFTSKRPVLILLMIWVLIYSSHCERRTLVR